MRGLAAILPRIALSAGLLVGSVGGVRAAPPERVCQSPDCLVVEPMHSAKGRVSTIGVLDTRLHLYVYVPPGTLRFTLGIYDQTDDGEERDVPAGASSRFDLVAPDGTAAQTLDHPARAVWSDYPISVAGRYGVWRLDVTGPEAGRNAFLVRTVGPVDLYLKPDAAARVRGLRFGAPCFGTEGGGWDSHQFLLALPGGEGMRLNLFYPAAWISSGSPVAAVFSLRAPDGPEGGGAVAALDGDDRMPRGAAFATRDLLRPAGQMRGLWRLAVRPPNDAIAGPSAEYGFGVDAGAADGAARVLFTARDGSPPLLPLPSALPVSVADGKAASLTITDASLPCAEPPRAVSTDAAGRAVLFLPPGAASGHVTAERTFGFAASLPTAVSVGRAAVLSPPRPLLPALDGWYAGDPHCHTTYYDGTDTPAQIAAAARAAGLDWLVVSEHAHGPFVERAVRAGREAASAIARSGGGLLVIPGMEVTTPTYHANVLGAIPPIPRAAPISDVLAAAREAERATGTPVAVAINHPTLGKTASEIARQAVRNDKLGLMELWNSREPDATRLWWDLLNAGFRVFAETGSDSHNLAGAPIGRRRTYVHSGGQSARGRLSTPAVIGALRAGHSFLSRGATVLFSVAGGLPGDTIRLPGKAANLPVRLSVCSARPIGRVDLIHNGQVLRSVPGDGRRTLDLTAELPPEPGWYLAQVWAVPGDSGNEDPSGGALVPLALCNPVFVAAVSSPATGSGE